MDLADPDDYKTISVLLNTQESVEKERRMSTVGVMKKEPAWFRRESMQRDSVLDPALYRVKVECQVEKLWDFNSKYLIVARGGGEEAGGQT